MGVSRELTALLNLTVSLGSQYSREDRERVNVVGLSMPLPLFDRNQGNVLAAARRVPNCASRSSVVSHGGVAAVPVVAL